MIKPRLIGFIAYRPAVYNKRYPTRMKRGLYDGYNSLPGEMLTINPRWRRVESDKRTIYGAQNVYHLGWVKPNYPVPSIYCHSLISKDCDERSNEMNYLDLILSL